MMTVDHIVPKSKGGLRTLDNLQPMCENCNVKKGNTHEECGQTGQPEKCVDIPTAI